MAWELEMMATTSGRTAAGSGPEEFAIARAGGTITSSATDNPSSSQCLSRRL
ncbi:MAG: hypothetical protein KME47_23240 [Nodosilinea sp. WJT8-NPBG4]|jgi:hypothetical protein|nr:hypothetical protein [Nodosilinea sp. WJT8-NPBG4]